MTRRPRKPKDLSKQATLSFMGQPPPMPDISKVEVRTGVTALPMIEVKAEPAPAVSAATLPVINVSVKVIFDRAFLRGLIEQSRRGPPLPREDDAVLGGPAVPRRHARPSTGIVIPVAPPYPQHTTPEYRNLRVDLREEMMRAYVMMSGAAKSVGFVTEHQHSVFDRDGMHGFYGGLDTKGLSYRKGKIDPETYWDRAGVPELSYNILRLRAATAMLRKLPEVNFVQDGQGKDVLAPASRRQAAENREKAGRAHACIGEELLGQFSRAHGSPGMDKNDRRRHPANYPLRDSIEGLVAPFRRAKKKKAPAVKPPPKPRAPAAE